MNYSLLKTVFSTILALALASPVTATDPLTEVIVTAELLTNDASQLSNSATIINSTLIERHNAQHLSDLLNLAPNVNFASGASRGRFIQIRGIGERSEFQEPLINSVGVLIDGIDMTGIATAANTLDIQQVELLRGPQGTLFGANAMAGLINMVSNRPTNDFSGSIGASFEEYGGLEVNGGVSQPISTNSAYRLAIKNYQSNGFTNNNFLNRKDTNNIDETTARGRYTIAANERLSLDLTVLLADVNNGYDAFSLDNTRQTYSDQPGSDNQQTKASSISANYAISDHLDLVALVSHAQSELEYSYDEDWSHLGICQGTACDSELFGFDWFYSSFDQYLRENDNTSIDLRFVSSTSDTTKWVIGLYHRDQNIGLIRRYTFNEVDFSSNLDTTNNALYGQFDHPLSDKWSLTAGLRYEQRDVNYRDNTLAVVATDENLWGGRFALEYIAANGTFYYGLVSRGYKAGGFNLDGSIAAEQQEFDSETLVNYEVGLKQGYFDDTLQVQASLFYQDRENIQTKQSIVASIETNKVGGTCPCSFTDFTANAASGSNSGIELELQWQASQRLELFATFGLLDTEFDTLLTFEHVNADRDNGIPYNLAGREQAHAPSYQWVFGGAFAINPKWTVSGSIESKDDFFFSDRHDEKSDAYELFNIELAYQTENWHLALYGKNLNDSLVKTRGFGSFGNDPRKFYVAEAYNQFAAPRIIGFKASHQF